MIIVAGAGWSRPTIILMMIIIIVELTKRRLMVGCRQRQERSDVLILGLLMKILVEILIWKLLLKISLVLVKVLLLIDERWNRMNRARRVPYVLWEFTVEIHR